MRIIQSAGIVAIMYELIHDTRIIPLDAVASALRTLLSPAIPTYMGAARGHWEGATLVVETSNLSDHTWGNTGSTSHRAVHSHRPDAIQYQVTFVDPATWAAPWTAALDLKSRPADSGVFDHACHEGNYGMFNMLSASRHLER